MHKKTARRGITHFKAVSLAIVSQGQTSSEYAKPRQKIFANYFFEHRFASCLSPCTNIGVDFVTELAKRSDGHLQSLEGVEGSWEAGGAAVRLRCICSFQSREVQEIEAVDVLANFGNCLSRRRMGLRKGS